MPHNVTTKLQFIYTRLFRFPLRAGRTISLAALSPTSSNDYDKLLREHRQLQNFTDTLRAELNQERYEKEQLAQVRLVHGWEAHGLVPAQVIQTLTGSDQIIINRGERENLTQGQFILANEAIVGTICELDGHQAKAALITDKSSCIPVYIESAQTAPKGLLYGLGNGQARIRNIRYQREVAIGDRVHIQTQPGLLEWPVVVGTVSQCQRDETDGLLWDITVKPASDLKSLSQVHVIVARTQ